VQVLPAQLCTSTEAIPAPGVLSSAFTTIRPTATSADCTVTVGAVVSGTSLKVVSHERPAPLVAETIWISFDTGVLDAPFFFLLIDQV
jgi:hypothetical protein